MQLWRTISVQGFRLQTMLAHLSYCHGIIIIPMLPRPDKRGSYIVGRVIRGKHNLQRLTRKAVEACPWCHPSPSVWTAALHSQPCVGAGLGHRLKSRMTRREFDPTKVRPAAFRSANHYATPASHICTFSETLTITPCRLLTLRFVHFHKR